MIAELPIGVRNSVLNRGIQTLAQRTKSSFIPENYIAIVGDSYAKGVGDEMVSMFDFVEGDYQARHFLHNKTGKDVLDFGLISAGNMQTYTVEIKARLDFVNSLLFFHVPDPEIIIAYFYEGNAFYDNLGRVNSVDSVPESMDVKEVFSAKAKEKFSNDPLVKEMQSGFIRHFQLMKVLLIMIKMDLDISNLIATRKIDPVIVEKTY